MKEATGVEGTREGVFKKRLEKIDGKERKKEKS